jgi:transposase
MGTRYSQSFKRQAVEKALSRADGTTLAEITDSLGIGDSTLHKWMVKSRNQQLGSSSEHDSASIGGVKKEKRPQDWNQEERLDMVIACGSLDESSMNQLCRERGLYAHHVRQWKQGFISASTANERTDAKSLKGEVRELKKELNRKDRALAETAALLVLQKKVSAIWGNDEDNSR